MVAGAQCISLPFTKASEAAPEFQFRVGKRKVLSPAQERPAPRSRIRLGYTCEPVETPRLSLGSPRGAGGHPPLLQHLAPPPLRIDLRPFAERWKQESDDLFWSNIRSVFPTFPALQRLLPEVEGTRVGEYDLLACIGEGAYGRVYISPDAKFGGFSAVKVINKGRLSAWNDLWGVITETTILLQLHHPNIIRFYGTIHARQNLYLFLELAGLNSLHQVISGAGYICGLKPQVTRTLFRQIADAVAYCHSQGVAHCDLKPQNVMVSDEGIAKLVDFGLAVQLCEPFSGPRGTWPFMSPEAAQAYCRPYDYAKADVWSLGVILLEMLSGIDKLSRILGWEMAPEWSQHRVVQLMAFHASPEALATRLASDIGPVPSSVMRALSCMLCSKPQQRWSAWHVAQQWSEWPASADVEV